MDIKCKTTKNSKGTYITICSYKHGHANHD